MLHVDCVPGPAKEVGAVRLGDAEQLAHHEPGEGERHRGVEVGGGAARLHAVEHLADDAVDPRSEAFHAAGRERPGQQPPHPDVVLPLGVGISHRAPEEGRLGHADGMPGVGVGAAEPRVGKELLHELVAGDEPRRLATGAGQPLDRAACRQSREPGRGSGLFSEAGDRWSGRRRRGLSAPDRKYGDAESASCAPSARREERRVPGRYASDEQRRDRGCRCVRTSPYFREGALRARATRLWGPARRDRCLRRPGPPRPHWPRTARPAPRW